MAEFEPGFEAGAEFFEVVPGIVEKREQRGLTLIVGNLMMDLRMSVAVGVAAGRTKKASDGVGEIPGRNVGREGFVF